MTKLVFGIAAVICIHVSYVAYLHLQTPFELALAPVESELVDRHYPYSAEEPTEVDYASHSPLVQPSIRKPRHANTKRRSELRPVKAAVLTDDLIIRVARSPSSTPPTITTIGEFQSVVISYRRQAPDIRQLKMQDRSLSSTGLALIY